MTETERITHEVIDRHIAAGRKAEVEGEERTRIGNTPTCEDCGKPESECACYFEEDEEQAESAAKLEAETLTARMIEPRPSIDAAAGKIESDSPLFYGTIHPTLF